MQSKMIKHTLSILGLTLCLALASLPLISHSNFQDTKSMVSDVYRLMDDNEPEKVS